MPTHESKTCPACGRDFECRQGSIQLCQCSGIELSLEERLFIEQSYTDCLCRDCLNQIKSRYRVYLETYIYSKANR